MTNQDRKDLQEFRALLHQLNEPNKAKALEMAAQMLVAQMAAKEEKTS